jgi:hypothetical protein
MKNFTVTLSLRKYFQLEGSALKPGQRLLVIDNNPCEFLSKKKKLYKQHKSDLDSSAVLMMHYKVKMLDDSLYPKNKEVEVFENELSIDVVVQPVMPKKITKKHVRRSDVITAMQEEYPSLRMAKNDGYFYIYSHSDSLAKVIKALPNTKIKANNMKDLTLEQWIKAVKDLFSKKKK